MRSVPAGATLSEDEVREVISLQLVIDSARDAGLEVATPVPGGEGTVLLAYGAAATATGPLHARRVGVRVFDSGLETVALPISVPPGELLALVEWGGFSVEENEDVFLFIASNLDEVRSGRRTLSEFRASSERWRMLVLG